MRSYALVLASLLIAGCGAPPDDAVGVDPAEAAQAAADGKADGLTAAAVPQVRCAATPSVGARGRWRHLASRLIVIGGAHHRGLDLVTGAGAAVQTLEGEISYGPTDKALEDEDVDLFACRAGAWQPVGTARTDGEGHFALPLQGAARLPVGVRDLYVSVVGDRSGVGFVGMVAPAGTKLTVSDVDGTLTSSENAFPESLVTGADVAIQPGAPGAFAELVRHGELVVYLTARGRVFTEATRRWLAQKGMPRGALRLAPSLVLLPGGPTADYKADTLAGLGSSGLVVDVGVGNRKSDIEAYTRTGVDAGHIFIKLPEYESEVQPLLDAGEAVGIDHYDELAAVARAMP